MALNNFQYDTIMRDYSRIQAKNRRLLEERTREVYSALPRVREIEDEIAGVSVAGAKALLSGDADAPDRAKARIAALTQERGHILREGGYSPDYLQMPCDCPDCRDTGYIGNQKCHCFKRAEIDLLYTQSNLRDILQEENFQTFSYAYYSDRQADGSGGLSPLARIRKAVEISLNFVRNFDTEFNNLLFYGDTGVGKTFLSHCIAKELLDTTHSVVYFSARDLFDAFAQERFHSSDQEPGYTDGILGCDLLIIDDLGTELTNALVNTEFFACINDRLVNRRSTIISTNLSLKQLAAVYSERIFSRITSGYTIMKLVGKDIRLLKKAERKSDTDGK